jgi:hypothetical protein
MRKQTTAKHAPADTDPARPEALDSADLAGFEALPQDLAPTQLVPESSTPPPELRTLSLEPELSTLAMPGKELRPIKTAEIPPTLLPGSSSSHPRRSLAPWLIAGAAILLLVGGGGAWYLWPRLQGGGTAARPAEAPAPEPVPPELRPYLAQAQGGDAKAMHMIALMYWNGLNVRQDRVKGLEWYRKAAAAGSTAAREALKTIEGK